ncbi:MAG: hypothetical protein J5X22_21155 [Candidatus Accumulibacter sp.]|uniref:peptidoglycan-binding domain-containing protein n=1 Tax=Accumulibacter sp. TaxID=2053492 RepID=UPI001AC46042|nr:hypothetical protein [Accumulibacter sp.]MBN8519866.1 hypothetical protein [Accumulibacter sp.]MBO3712900.1 hypothetical protein [Accumulibacter sp.]
MNRRHLVSFAFGFAAFAAAFPPDAHAWCAAMGGYSSFEEQARAEARKRRVQVIRSDQQSLQTLGFYRAAVDGTEGPATSRAIASFRVAVGLGDGNDLDDDARRRLNACVQARQKPTRSPNAVEPTDACCAADKPECLKAFVARR